MNLEREITFTVANTDYGVWDKYQLEQAVCEILGCEKHDIFKTKLHAHYNGEDLCIIRNLKDMRLDGVKFMLRGRATVPFETLLSIVHSWTELGNGDYYRRRKYTEKGYTIDGFAERQFTDRAKFDCLVSVNVNPLLVRDAKDGFEREYSLRGCWVDYDIEGVNDISLYDYSPLNYDKLKEELGLCEESVNFMSDFVCLHNDTEDCWENLCISVASLTEFEEKHNLRLI
jgi:hypothetical protein